MGISGYRIDLVWQKGSSRPHGTTGSFQQGWLHVVFKTPALDEDYKRLTEAKANVVADKDSQSKITRLLLHDPEGNEIEIFPK